MDALSIVARDDHGLPAEQRIIGIEIRLQDAAGFQEEIAIIPCDVRLPLSTYPRPRLNVTFHTSFELRA